MTYKECLEKIKGLNMLQVNVAYEVSIIDFPLEDYERVCQFIYGCALECDLSVSDLCQCFEDLLEDGEEEKDIVNWHYYKFIEKARYNRG